MNKNSGEEVEVQQENNKRRLTFKLRVSFKLVKKQMRGKQPKITLEIPFGCGFHLTNQN